MRHSRRPNGTALFYRELGPTWFEQASDEFLLDVGSVVARNDYAVVHYGDIWHPKFFGRHGPLLHAVRRGLAQYPAEQLEGFVDGFVPLAPDESPTAPFVADIRAGLAEWDALWRALDHEQRCHVLAEAGEGLNNGLHLDTDGDGFLEELGWTSPPLSEDPDDDSEWVMVPPPVLPNKLHPATVYLAFEGLRTLWDWQEPHGPPADILQITARLRASLRTGDLAT